MASNPRKMSLNEMSRDLSMNKTTLFRFLQTLEALHLLEKKNGAYVPGIKLFELGSKVPVKQLIVEKAHPILMRLAEEVNETVNFGELNKNCILYLDKCESKRSLQIQTGIGSRISLYATALGKAALSLLPAAERDAIISRIHLESITKKTITDPQKLKTYIEEVNRKGYSLDIEELELGMHCVAVPLPIPELNFFGAISFAGPSVRFTRSRMAELAGKLKVTVKEIRKTINIGGD